MNLSTIRSQNFQVIKQSTPVSNQIFYNPHNSAPGFASQFKQGMMVSPKNENIIGIQQKLPFDSYRYGNTPKALQNVQISIANPQNQPNRIIQPQISRPLSRPAPQFFQNHPIHFVN
jgi:hypothetical protein